MAANKFETGEAATFTEGDFNGDGVVGTADIVLMLGTGLYETGPYFVPVVSAQNIPEPSTMALLGLGLVALCGRRVRRV